MNAEILAVGSELLTSSKVDTNSLWLTDQFNLLGVEIAAKGVVGDDRARLADVFANALQRSDILILTGGLGPTEDDVTRDAVAQALGRGQHFRQDICDAIAARFRQFGRTMAEINKRQAFIIDGAEDLPNPRGTAPGQWIQLEGPKAIALLPGVPHEMKHMFASQCLPRLKPMVPPLAIATSHFRVAGMGESDLDQLIAPVYTKYSNPVTTILAGAGDIHIHLRARGATDAEASALIAELAPKIEELLGDRIYSRNGDDLETAVGRMLKDRNATVAVAESCTGGLLGQRITSVSGSSNYFCGGFITYTNEMKAAFLGVLPATLQMHTAVSEQVAIEMASGARARTGATYTLSITGYAEGENGGLVFVGLASAQSVTARKLQFPGERDRVRSMAATMALNLLRLDMLHGNV